MPNQGTTVGLDDVREIRCGKLPVRDPARELVVPNAIVPPEQLAVLLGQIGNHVPS